MFFSGVCGFGKNRSREIWHSRLILSSPKYTIKNDPFFSDLETQPYDLAENLHVAPNQWVMKKSRSEFSWENCFCCTFCAIFDRLLRFLCHFWLFRQKTHRCFDPSASSIKTKKLQHVPLRMLRKFGCHRITPHWDRGELPVEFRTLKTRTS